VFGFFANYFLEDLIKRYYINFIFITSLKEFIRGLVYGSLVTVVLTKAIEKSDFKSNIAYSVRPINIQQVVTDFK
jgi:hypothetical protein